MAAGTVESEHQLRPRPLPERLLCTQSGKLRQNDGVLAELDHQRQSLLQALKLQLLERRAVAVAAPCDLRSTPQRQRPSESVRCDPQMTTRPRQPPLLHQHQKTEAVGGDRQLNRALHTIILTRRRIDPQTKAYISRRLSEGKTERDAVRSLKRYLARSLYRQLEATPTAS